MKIYSSNDYFVKVLLKFWVTPKMPKLELLPVHLFRLLLKCEGWRLPESVLTVFSCCLAGLSSFEGVLHCSESTFSDIPTKLLKLIAFSEGNKSFSQH